MNTIIFKNKFMLILVVLISFFLYGQIEEFTKKQSGTHIFEIENTEESYHSPDGENYNIRKHYMIINPPTDLHELKIVVEKFIEDNPINKEIVGAENKNKLIGVFFYRESKKLSRDWQPSEELFNSDRLEFHRNDIIASIWSSDVEPMKKYHIMKKSSNKNDYGKVIERIEYLGDELVK